MKQQQHQSPHKWEEEIKKYFQPQSNSSPSSLKSNRSDDVDTSLSKSRAAAAASSNNSSGASSASAHVQSSSALLSSSSSTCAISSTAKDCRSDDKSTDAINNDSGQRKKEGEREERPSPEALRKARLAFFLATQQQQQQVPSVSSSSSSLLIPPVDPVLLNRKNNENDDATDASLLAISRLRSSSRDDEKKQQHNSLPTSPLSPPSHPKSQSQLNRYMKEQKQQVQLDQRVTSSGHQDTEKGKKRGERGPNAANTSSKTAINQQQQLLHQATGKTGSLSSTTAESKAKEKERKNAATPASSTVMDQDRIDVPALLRRLEEAIQAGQFDVAAVIAKQLAAIKSSSSSSLPSSSSDSISNIKVVDVHHHQTTAAADEEAEKKKTNNNSDDVGSNSHKIVAGVIESLPKQTADVAITKPITKKTTTDVDTPASVNNELPVSPPPLVLTATTKGPIKSKTEQQLSTTTSAVNNANPISTKTTTAAVVMPKKVDSSQQTAITYRQQLAAGNSSDKKNTSQIKSDVAAATKVMKPVDKKETKTTAVEEQVDDGTFKVQVMVEGTAGAGATAVTSQGPFIIAVHLKGDTTTLGQLKETLIQQMTAKSDGEERDENKGITGRWIIGRKLADDDTKTLAHYGLTCQEDAQTAGPIYFYILDPTTIRPSSTEKKKKEIESDAVSSQPVAATAAVAIQFKRTYYNHEEDRYSTCSEEEEEEGTEIGATAGAKEPQVPVEGAAMTTYFDDDDDAALAPNGEDVDCPICLMAVPARVGVTLRDCLHSFCRDCLAHVIEFSDEAAVSCPYRDDSYACPATIQQREIKALVNAQVFERHLARSVRLAEKAMQERAVHCQTADCTGWAVVGDDNVNIFRCPVCRQTNCLTCQAIHQGINCKEYQDRVTESAETDDDARRTKDMIDALFASGEALPCPQCHVVLMKRWGCDWVRCSVCRTEICWVTRQARWGPKGKGDTSAGCKCGLEGKKCHPSCNYCH